MRSGGAGQRPRDDWFGAWLFITSAPSSPSSPSPSLHSTGTPPQKRVVPRRSGSDPARNGLSTLSWRSGARTKRSAFPPRQRGFGNRETVSPLPPLPTLAQSRGPPHAVQRRGRRHGCARGRAFDRSRSTLDNGGDPAGASTASDGSHRATHKGRLSNQLASNLWVG